MKKMTITAVTLSVLLLAMISALVVVLVFTGQQATSSVKVLYSGQGVHLELSATAYWIEDGVNKSEKFVTSEGQNNLEISPNNQSGQLSPVNNLVPVELTRDNPNVIYEFKFVNLSSTADINIALSNLPGGTDNGVSNNMIVKYAFSDTSLASEGSLNIDNIGSQFSEYSDKILLANATKDATRYIYVIAKVDDLLFNAEYYGEIQWLFTRASVQEYSTDASNTTETSPAVVSTASQLLNIGVSVDENSEPTEEKHYILSQDIVIEDTESTTVALGYSNATTRSIVDSAGYVIPYFNGTIDGNGYTIHFKNLNSDGGYVLFGYIAGVVKNINLHFDNIQDSVQFASDTIGDVVFQNITTSGDITLEYTERNYSPLISFTSYNIRFVDCHNNLNIYGDSAYGSVFLGGYIYGVEVVNHVATEETSVDVSFIRCTNSGNITMTHASMLYGNIHRLPNLNNLTIEDCYNEGVLTGRLNAQLVTGHYLTARLNAASYYQTRVDWINAVNASTEIKNRNSGACITESRDTSITCTTPVTNNYASDGDHIVTNNSGKTLSYEVSLSVRIELVGGEHLILMTKRTELTDATTVNVGLMHYRFINEYLYQQLETAGTIQSSTEMTDVTINSPIEGLKIYLVQDTSGVSYYYIKLPDDVLADNEDFTFDAVGSDKTKFSYSLNNIFKAYNEYGEVESFGYHYSAPDGKSHGWV